MMATAPVLDHATTLPERMLLGGRLVSGEGALLTVLNPSSGAPVISFAGASSAQFDQAIGHARASFDKGEWANRKPAERLAVLQRFQN
ncbi:MAG TPA: aldehyde dehydrogenase family protein, partial [Sphingobium sp.]